MTMTTILAALVMVMAMVQVCAATTTSFSLTGSSVIIKPNSTFTNTGGYDYKNNALRYTALVAAKAKADATAKSAAKTWGVLVGANTLLSGKNVVIAPHKQLVFKTAGVLARSKLSVTFSRTSSLSLIGTGLSLTNALLNFTDRSTSLVVSNGDLALTSSHLTGSLQQFTVSSISLNVTKSNLHLLNTPFQITYTRFIAHDSSVDIKRSGPSAPAAPFLIYQSYVDLKTTYFKFINIPDAFFVQSTVTGGPFTVEIVNSNVRFIDCKLSFKSAKFLLKNSTIQFLDSTPTVDKYLATAKGGLADVPSKIPSPRQVVSDVLFNAHVKGTGSFTLVSTK